jgi:hypothetical protein
VPVVFAEGFIASLHIPGCVPVVFSITFVALLQFSMKFRSLIRSFAFKALQGAIGALQGASKALQGVVKASEGVSRPHKELSRLHKELSRPHKGILIENAPFWGPGEPRPRFQWFPIKFLLKM